MRVPDDVAIKDEEISTNVIPCQKLRPHMSSFPVLMILGSIVENPAVSAHCIQIVDWLAEDGEISRNYSMWCTAQTLLFSDQEFVVRPPEFRIRQVGIVVFDRDDQLFGAWNIVEELLSPRVVVQYRHVRKYLTDVLSENLSPRRVPVTDSV